MKNKGKIKSLKAREILDSRGNPTVEVDLITDFGLFRSSVPSGASRGKYEAFELRDKEKRYHGKGVKKAVRNINKIIAPKLKAFNPTKQKEIDNFLIKLDGTKNKSKLGANAITGVSMAVCRAGAAAKNVPLWQHISQLFTKNYLPRRQAGRLKTKNYKIPVACFNVINGGIHAGNELDFQEFMIVPQLKVFSKSLQIASEIYHQLKEIIKDKYIDLAINVGDEGGFAPPVRAPEEALNLILETAKKLNYQKKIKIILDCAASQFFTNEKYRLKIGVFTREELFNYYSLLISKYPILGLEDPFSEDDWEGWKRLNEKLKMKNEKLLVIGDDLTVTNSKRIQEAQERRVCNAMILKINQIGTVSEALEAARLAKSYNWKIMVSHRSGETCDDFISDFAVGIRADYIKTGAPCRGERVAKYNRLLRMEEELQ